MDQWQQSYFHTRPSLSQLQSQLRRALEDERQRLPEEICQHLQLELESKGLGRDALFSALSSNSSPSPSSGSGPPSNCSTPSYPSTPHRTSWNTDTSQQSSNASFADSTSSSTTPVMSESEMSLG